VFTVKLKVSNGLTFSFRKISDVPNNNLKNRATLHFDLCLLECSLNFLMLSSKKTPPKAENPSIQ